MNLEEEDPNKIWKKFDIFVRQRISYIPADFKYPDLNRYPLDKHQALLGEIIGAMVRNEACIRSLRLLGEWDEFFK